MSSYYGPSGGNNRGGDRRGGGDRDRRREDHRGGGGGNRRGGYDDRDRDRDRYGGDRDRDRGYRDHNRDRYGDRGGGGGYRDNRGGSGGGGGGGGGYHRRGDRGDSGRGGGGGRSRGRGGGRGRGGPPLPIPKEALSNLIPARVTPNFRFYQYGLDGSNIEGKLIDSRRRKAELLNVGLFDAQQGLLARNGMSMKDIDDMRRVTFFEGSFMFTARRVPFLDTVPFSLVGSKEKNVSADSQNVPIMDNGDCMTVTAINVMTAPELITMGTSQGSKGGQLKEDSSTIHVEKRCANCSMAFTSMQALMHHCQTTGHQPVRAADEKDVEPANNELFTSFCNVALQRAMGERMARWGKEYIDPKNWTEPTDKQGRSLGVRIFRAYVSASLWNGRWWMMEDGEYWSIEVLYCYLGLFAPSMVLLVSFRFAHMC